MKKILIVEDNNDYRVIINLFIAKMGYQAITAKNSSEAITFAEAEQPDLIFMDMDLPDVGGVETTAMLKQNPKTSHIPVVACTAWLSTPLEERASKVGVATYLIKPVSPQMLKKTIEEYLKRVTRPKRGVTLAFWLALFVGLALVTESRAEDYYFYEGPKGELVISNKEPPPGSKIIKRLPGMADKEVPQAQAEEPAKPQPKIQPEGSPKPSKTK